MTTQYHKETTKIMCKGAWSLGSACGQCITCQETALPAALDMQKKLKDFNSIKQAKYASHGLLVNKELQNIAFVDSYDAQEYAKRIWESGKLIEIVYVGVILLKSGSPGQKISDAVVPSEPTPAQQPDQHLKHEDPKV